MIDAIASPEAGEHLVLLRPPLVGDDQRDVASHRLGGSPAEHPLGRAVPGGDDAVERLADDGVVGGVDDGRQPRPRQVGIHADRLAWNAESAMVQAIARREADTWKWRDADAPPRPAGRAVRTAGRGIAAHPRQPLADPSGEVGRPVRRLGGGVDPRPSAQLLEREARVEPPLLVGVRGGVAAQEDLPAERQVIRIDARVHQDRGRAVGGEGVVEPRAVVERVDGPHVFQEEAAGVVDRTADPVEVDVLRRIAAVVALVPRSGRARLRRRMPEPMSEEEIEEIIDDVISQVEATSIRDMGRVMAGVMHQVSGRADGSTVSQLVKEKLA